MHAKLSLGQTESSPSVRVVWASVAIQIALEDEAVAAEFANEGSLVVVHIQVVKQVAHFLELRSAASPLAHQQLLPALRGLCVAHYLVVFLVGNQ